MSWRLYIKDLLLDNNLNDIYEFGVYSGESVYDIKNIYDSRNIPIRKFFCFDSFEGLPEEKNEPIFQECWAKGNFNAQEKFNVNSVEECIKAVDSVIRQNAKFKDELVYIPGFYENVLIDDIVQKYDMRPAKFVDMDADIYTSTYIALDFMMRNRLIIPGTIIAYDDWGGTPDWEFNLTGESRAHKEICDKYNMHCELIRQFGSQFPHVQTVFIVNDVKG